MAGNGKLVICGGNINGSWRNIYGEFLRLCGGSDANIIVVATASDEPIESYLNIKNKLVSLGLNEEKISLLNLFCKHAVKTLGIANDSVDKMVAQLSSASGVWFTGGDQLRITAELLNNDYTDTLPLTAMREILKRNGVIGGSSAGAAVMSEVMICCGSDKGCTLPPLTNVDEYLSDKSNEQQERLLISRGLGFFTQGIIDQHFNTRPRQQRLITAMRLTNNVYGYGVSEDTALVCDLSCNTLHVIGSACIKRITLDGNNVQIDEMKE